MQKYYGLKIFSLTILLFLLVGCGFHLRGSFSIPTILQVLRISPYQPIDPFQRPLRQALKSNGVKLVNDTNVSMLTILSQAITERTVAYGADGQVNRSSLQFTVHYQISNPTGKIIVPDSTVRVERMLTVVPNSVLGTENERARVINELYQDAALQLMRQLSILHANSN